MIKETTFFKNHAENESGKPVPEFFLFFEKVLHKIIKKVGCSLVSIYFGNPHLGKE